MAFIPEDPSSKKKFLLITIILAVIGGVIGTIVFPVVGTIVLGAIGFIFGYLICRFALKVYEE